MEATDSLHARTRWLTFATALAFASLSAQAARVVVTDGATVARDAPASHRTSPRGRIVASGGEVLAENVAGFEVDVAPTELSRAPWAIDRLAALLGYNDTAVLQGEVMRAASRGTRVLRVSRGVDAEVVRRVRAERHELPGVWVTSIAQRRYPFGVLTAFPVGFMGDVGERDLAEPMTYRIGDRVGVDGIERSWELTLRGESSYASEHRGMTLATTLDMRLQSVAARAFAGLRGTLVALDARTGALLAYVSSPSTDPDRFELSRVGDPALPSDFVTGLADARIPTLGAASAPALREVLTTLARAESGSCDARANAPSITAERLTLVGHSLGLGSVTGVDLRDEPFGEFLVDSGPDEAHTGADGASFTLYVSSLHVAVSFAAMINGGIVYQPRIVERVLHPDGSVAATMPPVVRGRLSVPACARTHIVEHTARSFADEPSQLPTVPLPNSVSVTMIPENDPRVVIVSRDARSDTHDRPHLAHDAALAVARAYTGGSRP